MKARFEFQPRDLWVGLYTRRRGIERHVWICVLPCVPLHVWWLRR